MARVSQKTFTLFVLISAVGLLAGCSSSKQFQGTELQPPILAAPFQLQDQRGQTVSLADYKGKVVALTFLYTNCPDVCPLTTQALHQAYDALGNDTARVTFVAITVDPARDTVQQLYAYSQQKGMLDKWHFLTGSLDELSPLWESYFIAADPYLTDPGGAMEQLSQATLAQEAQQQGLPATYFVTHQAPVYLIDQQGAIRVLDSDVTLDAKPLVQDIKALLKQQ